MQGLIAQQMKATVRQIDLQAEVVLSGSRVLLCPPGNCGRTGGLALSLSALSMVLLASKSFRWQRFLLLVLASLTSTVAHRQTVRTAQVVGRSITAPSLKTEEIRYSRTITGIKVTSVHRWFLASFLFTVTTLPALNALLPRSLASLSSVTVRSDRSANH